MTLAWKDGPALRCWVRQFTSSISFAPVLINSCWCFYDRKIHLVWICYRVGKLLWWGPFTSGIMKLRNFSFKKAHLCLDTRTHAGRPWLTSPTSATTLKFNKWYWATLPIKSNWRLRSSSRWNCLSDFKLSIITSTAASSCTVPASGPALGFLARLCDA